MAAADTSTMSDVQLFMLEDFEFEVPCDSYHCNEEQHKPTHAADWAILYSCGHGMNWCQERFHFYVASDLPLYGGVWCTQCNLMLTVKVKVINHFLIKG